MQTVTLNNETTMPSAGYGVLQIPDAQQRRRCVVDAIEVGDRLIAPAGVKRDIRAARLVGGLVLTFKAYARDQALRVEPASDDSRSAAAAMVHHPEVAA